MPDGDGTGPRWAQGRWNCRRGAGRGLGMGFGRGAGRGFRAGYLAAGYPAVPSVQSGDERADLKAYSDELKAELDEVKRRMASLEKGD